MQENKKRSLIPCLLLFILFDTSVDVDAVPTPLPIRRSTVFIYGVMMFCPCWWVGLSSSRGVAIIIMKRRREDRNPATKHHPTTISQKLLHPLVYTHVVYYPTPPSSNPLIRVPQYPIKNSFYYMLPIQELTTTSLYAYVGKWGGTL